MMYVSQIITLYVLKLCSGQCQLYLNKTRMGEKNVLFTFHIFANFPVFLLLWDFLFHPTVVRKDNLKLLQSFKIFAV